MRKVLSIALGVLLLASAVAHAVFPAAYADMIPDFIPQLLANILATITELAVGIALIIPHYRRLGGLGFLLMMVAFMPLHIWDLTKEAPAIGSHGVAIFRIVMQVALIYAGWWIWKGKEA